MIFLVVLERTVKPDFYDSDQTTKIERSLGFLEAASYEEAEEQVRGNPAVSPRTRYHILEPGQFFPITLS